MKADILAQLPADHPWRDSIHWFASIDSTNTQAKALAAAGAPHGTILIADSQTAGRGRLGRTFQSPSGAGIYMSVVLRPHCPASDLMHLTCATAVALCDAVEKTLGFRPHVKWINDLVWERRKLAGILTELAFDPKTSLVDYAVIGIGINCNQTPEDFPPDLRQIACSAAMACGRPVKRSRLAASMICALERMSQQLLSEQHTIMCRYRQDCITIGADVSIVHGQVLRYGKAVDVQDDGGLLVTFGDGHSETVNAGEVSVRGLYGYT